MINEQIEKLRNKLEQLIQCSNDLSCSEVYNASKELDLLISQYHRDCSDGSSINPIKNCKKAVK